MPSAAPRQGETWLKKTTAALFYRLMRDVGERRSCRATPAISG